METGGENMWLQWLVSIRGCRIVPLRKVCQPYLTQLLCLFAVSLTALGTLAWASYQDILPPSFPQRLRQATTELLREKRPGISYPKFEYVQQGTPARPRGLYYNLGRIMPTPDPQLTPNADLPQSDVLAEVIRQQGWLDLLEKSLPEGSPERTYLKDPISHARMQLETFFSKAETSEPNEELVATIQDTMDKERKAMRSAVAALAASKNLPPILAPDHGLGGDIFDVTITTDPSGGDIRYLPLMWAIEQMVRKDATHPRGRKFPDELEYLSVVTNSMKLAGPYVFRVKWAGADPVYRNITVDQKAPITLRKAN
jgi:hypothetical protein